MSLIEIFFLLIAGHYLADFALQNDFLAQAKNRNTAIGKVFWPHALTAHSAIHGLIVGLITGSLLLSIAEAIAHAMIDFSKCENRIGIHADQALHIGCKVLYVAFLALI